MSLEKVGLMLLINYFNQWGDVKNHVLLAAKEVILAVKTSFDIVSHSTSKVLLGQRAEVLNPIFDRINNLLDYSVTQITTSVAPEAQASGLDALALKEHIVSSIITAIDDEILNTKEMGTERNRLKVEALHTVKEVLLSQMGQPSSVVAKKGSKKNVA